MKTTHSITVLGREISVRSSASIDKVRAVEQFVNNRLHDIGAALKSGDSQLVLMLALLNTAEELLDARSGQVSDNIIDARLHGILAKLERA